MTATQLPLLLAQRYRNQQLFSESYLTAITCPPAPSGSSSPPTPARHSLRW